MTALTTLSVTLSLLTISESVAFRAPPPPCGTQPQMLYPGPQSPEIPLDGWVVVGHADSTECPLVTTSTASTFDGGFGTYFKTLRPRAQWTPQETFTLSAEFGQDIQDITVGTVRAEPLTMEPTIRIESVRYHPLQEDEPSRFYEFRGTIELPEREKTSIAQIRLEPPAVELDIDKETLVALAATEDQLSFTASAWLWEATGSQCLVLHVRDQAGGFGPSAKACGLMESSDEVDVPTLDENGGGCRAVSGPDVSLLILTGIWLAAIRRRRRR